MAEILWCGDKGPQSKDTRKLKEKEVRQLFPTTKEMMEEWNKYKNPLRRYGGFIICDTCLKDGRTVYRSNKVLDMKKE